MDEPTHPNESRFWDDVADWLLVTHDIEQGVLSAAEIAALWREIEQGHEPPWHHGPHK